MYGVISGAATRSVVVAAKPIVQIALVGAIIWLAAGPIAARLGQLQMADIMSAFGATSWSAIGAAALLTAFSLLAVSTYDALAWPSLAAGVKRCDAMRSGFTAIAIGQATGFGPVVGCFARYRLLKSKGITATLSARSPRWCLSGFSSA